MPKYGSKSKTIEFKCQKCGKYDIGFSGQKFCHKRICFKVEFNRTCPNCKKEFSTYKKSLKYCSKPCRVYDHYSLHSPWKAIGLATATVGAMHELKVSYDLLMKGYEVFRAQSPSCSCDLLILDKGVPKRVEVRTGYYLKGGGLTYPEKKDASHKYEIMAVVTKDKIHYLPNGVVRE